MNKQTTCADIGYKCTMEEKLDVAREPIYEYREVPATGPDARPGDTWKTRIGSPIGYQLRYTAYWQCSHCKSKKIVGRKTVPEGTRMTFSDFANAKAKEKDFEKKLADFDQKQKKERDDFIRKNKPKF